MGQIAAPPTEYTELTPPSPPAIPAGLSKGSALPQVNSNAGSARNVRDNQNLPEQLIAAQPGSSIYVGGHKVTRSWPGFN